MNKKTCQERLQRCGQLMESAGMDVLILVKPANMHYLTGDGRLCAYAMITKDLKVVMGVPQTDIDDVKRLAHFDHIVGFENEVGLIHSVAHYFKDFGITKGVVGLEYSFLPAPRMGMFTHPHAKPEGVEPKDCTPIMSALRLVKDSEEIERMRAAGRVADAGMKAAVTSSKPGMTESQVAAEAEYAMRQAGADEFYRTYVSSGRRTNIAHGLPTQKKLEEGGLIMIDVHPVVNGYCSDLCRTVCVGKPTAEQQAAHDLYVKALEATIAKVRQGVGIDVLEQTMHDIFTEAGHKDHIFGPPIHGIGLEFEEAPLPAGHAFFHGEKGPGPLAAGTVIAIGNCGLYTGPWGIRVEDTVAVGPEGPQILTGFVRKLEV
ncbi:MAG TPA: Xaa-Pro peptidase family protein [Smithellaceae bacterium]|nr:Xaa-Pro peptidase family protein [Smithellaceae bacterium]